MLTTSIKLTWDLGQLIMGILINSVIVLTSNVHINTHSEQAKEMHSMALNMDICANKESFLVLLPTQDLNPTLPLRKALSLTLVSDQLLDMIRADYMENNLLDLQVIKFPQR